MGRVHIIFMNHDDSMYLTSSRKSVVKDEPPYFLVLSFGDRNHPYRGKKKKSGWYAYCDYDVYQKFKYDGIYPRHPARYLTIRKWLAFINRKKISPW